MSRIVMVSPCGTSILTNQADEQIKPVLTATADAREKDLSPEQKINLEIYIKKRRQAILSADVSAVSKWSAELNGILSYYGGQIPPKADIHILLATATYQGQQTTQLIASWLQQQGCQVQIAEVSPDLNVRSADEFRLAMAELVEWAERTLPGYRESQYQIVFNLTGGFKSVNGFLQTIGMFYADECVYIFQNSSELIQIPRLPIKLDVEGMIGANLLTFRRLDQQQDLSTAECAKLPETLLFISDGKARLSEWGQLVWQRCKQQYYSQQLLEPLSPKIRYSDAFRKTVAALPPQRKEIINKQLDQLSRCLDSQQTYNPKSLDFKALKGNPYPSTHQCDAWSDLDAQRLFGHFEGDTFVIDQLGQG
ncbi:MAG: hypothetical protein Q6K81_02720, partial [Gloeomargarita sp. DG02_5_bins_242]